MLYLDNDVLAKFARPDPDPAVIEFLKQHRTESWAISTIVAYEFLSFYSQSRRREKLQLLEQRIVNEITPFETRTSLEAANIQELLTNTDTSLDTGDLLIAATARQHGGTLATANKNDFDKPAVRQLLDVEIVPTTQ